MLNPIESTPRHIKSRSLSLSISSIKRPGKVVMKKKPNNGLRNGISKAIATFVHIINKNIYTKALKLELKKTHLIRVPLIYLDIYPLRLHMQIPALQGP